VGLHKDASINDEVVTENDTKNVTKNVTEHLTDRQLKIIELIRKDTSISIGAIAEQCNVTKMTINRDIAKMSHIVVHIGPKNGGKWNIIDND
jgi:predicted HTH transcriptional regulator